MLGKKVKVTVDRPMGTYHPQHKDLFYPINYGYIEGIIAPDGEEQDAYILGVDTPVDEFEGIVIAIIHRNNDIEEKWVVAPEGSFFTKEEIEEAVRFQEQFFEYENNRYKYTISIGYADYPEQADGLKAVVNHADEALYSAKLAGKHRCFHFEPAMANAKRTQLGFSFKDVVNGIPGALLIYSAAGDEEILYANNELIKLMGCSDFEDFMAWSKGSFRGFVHPDDLDEVEESIYRQIDGSLSEKNHQEDYVEYRIIRKDGSILPVVDIGRLISTENHGDVFFVFIRPRDEFKKNF